jgi:phage/plasmid-like protein (TIGR03299 family)
MLNTNQILEQNGLNWNVVKKPLMYAGECTPEANNGLHHTPYYGIVREDTGEVFTTVSKAYEPTQNRVIIETMQEIAGDNDLEIVKALPLHDGRKIVVQMRRPNNIIDIGGESTEQYVYAINGHDGSSSLKFGFMNKVIFCQNQFGWLSGNAFSGYRHTKSIQEKVEQLPSIINFSDQYDRIADLQEFSKETASPKLISDLVNYLAETDKVWNLEEKLSTRKENMINNLMSCIDSEMNRVTHTKWGAFNGVTKYTTHEKSSPNREYGKQESILTGSCGKMNEKAFNFLKAY